MKAQLTTYLYDDTEGISGTLTPAHMMYDHQIINSPSERHFDITIVNRLLTKQAKYQFWVLNDYIRQWRREYLLGLREYSIGSTKKQGRGRTIKTVVLKEDCTHRSWWKLARVIDLRVEMDWYGQQEFSY